MNYIAILFYLSSVVAAQCGDIVSRSPSNLAGSSRVEEQNQQVFPPSYYLVKNVRIPSSEIEHWKAHEQIELEQLRSLPDTVPIFDETQLRADALRTLDELRAAISERPLIVSSNYQSNRIKILKEGAVRRLEMHKSTLLGSQTRLNVIPTNDVAPSAEIVVEPKQQIP